MKFETSGGDDVQQARRAAMWSAYETPTYWLNLCETGFVHGMRNTGNQNDRELANVVAHLVRAVEFGATVDALSERLASRIEAEPEPLASVWRAVALALQGMAQARIDAEHEHARIEAIEAMTPAAQAA